MDIRKMTDEELANAIDKFNYGIEMIKDSGFEETLRLTKFIRQCVEDSRKDMWELIDGAEPIISIWKTESPSQVKFKELWLAKARKALASVEGKE